MLYYPHELVDAIKLKHAVNPKFKAMEPFVGCVCFCVHVLLRRFCGDLLSIYSPEQLETKEQVWAFAKQIIQPLAAAQSFFVLDGYVTEYVEMQV